MRKVYVVMAVSESRNRHLVAAVCSSMKKAQKYAEITERSFERAYILTEVLI